MAPPVAAWDYVTLRASTVLRAEDNVQRLPDGVNSIAPDGTSGRSDIIRTYSTGASLDLPLSRQRLLLSYDVNRTEYGKFTNLDFEGDSRRATLHWELGSSVTGDAGIAQTTNQSDLADALGRRPNLRTTTRKFFDARYPILGRWRLGGGINQTDSTNSDPVNHVSDSTTDGMNLELKYGPDSGNYLGIRTGRSEVSYPNPVVAGGVATDNGYKQDTLAFVAGYAPGGPTSLQLALGQNRRVPNEASRRTSTGTTGSLDLAWAPTGRTSFNLMASREFAPAEDITTTNSVVDSALLGAGWRATAKLHARGDLSYQRRNFSLSAPPLAGFPASRTDTTTFARLTLTYAAHDRIALSLSLRKEQRDSTLSAVDYTAGIVSATAQVTF